MSSGRIYVQIPAYRDRELIPTVVDLVSKAQRPEDLTVAVAWQYSAEERHLESVLRAIKSVRLLASPAEHSEGPNWARRRLQDHWDGEEYTLFLDSHHRFVPGWDQALISMHRDLEDSGVAKPVVSGYLPPYVPGEDPARRYRTLYKLKVYERLEGLAFRLMGYPIEGWRQLEAPQPAAFVSLHLLFARGEFNREVPLDAEVYFFADEVAVALRAFTHGYDVFSPHEVIGWHLFDRSTRVTHWDDHGNYRQRSAGSLSRLRSLYSGSAFDSLGLGRARTAAEYEAATGVALILDEESAPGRRPENGSTTEAA